jgi:hypothetical protein
LSGLRTTRTARERTIEKLFLKLENAMSVVLAGNASWIAGPGSQRSALKQDGKVQVNGSCNGTSCVRPIWTLAL